MRDGNLQIVMLLLCCITGLWSFCCHSKPDDQS